MRAPLLALAASLLALTAPAQQSTFEGTVVFQLEHDATMTYSSGHGLVRLDIGSEHGAVVTLTDPVKRTLTIMMSGQKMYMVRDMPDIGSGIDSSAKLTNTGKTDVIAGVKCELWHAASPTGSYDVCAARDMGKFFFGMGGRRDQPSWSKQLRGDFFPLRVVNEKGETVMLATKVEKKKLDKSFFTVPSDYTKMEMPSMPGGGAPPSR